MSDDPTADAGTELDPVQVEFVKSQLRADQNLFAGVLAGAVSALAGASVWAAITFFTGYQIGLIAVAIGMLVGFSVRVVGKGIDPTFGVVGAFFSLLGCAVGNLLAVTAIVAAQQEVPFFEALPQLTPELAMELMQATFSPMDLIFYGVAVWEGWRFSFRQLSPDEIERMLTGSGGMASPPPPPLA